MLHKVPAILCHFILTWSYNVHLINIYVGGLCREASKPQTSLHNPHRHLAPVTRDPHPSRPDAVFSETPDGMILQEGRI